jgi:hypothetical protein
MKIETGNDKFRQLLIKLVRATTFYGDMAIN